MTRSLRWISVCAAFVLALGTVPALADEGADATGDETTTEESSFADHKFMILFAEGFGATEEDVAALAELGLGWGDLFKLNVYATVLGKSVEDVLAGATFDDETDEWDFGWGELRASLSEEELAALEGFPRNFGAVVSAAHRHQGRDAHQSEHAASGEDNPGKGSKPDHAGRDGEKPGKGPKDHGGEDDGDE